MRRRPMLVCANDGVVFEAPRPDALYCSLRCKEQAKKARSPERACLNCGTLFHTKYDKRKVYCSMTCAPKLAQGRPPIAPEVLAHRAVLHEIEVRRRRQTRLEARLEVWSKLCLGCGQPVGSGSGWNGAAKRYCTRACFQASTRLGDDADARRRAKDNRRARKRGAFVAVVNRRHVYERDGWTCQLCGHPVDRNAKVPEPSAPSLDHVLALANGGTHEPANVQLAHFLCNALKGDRVGVGTGKRWTAARPRLAISRAEAKSGPPLGAGAMSGAIP
jgi:5-methylcytosine-specific restriction endonuclease McrA